MTVEAVGPLAGVRVVELAGLGPAPYCAMMMADLGADVVRVDRPGQPEDPPWPVVGRGRRSVTVDLKHPSGPEALLALVDNADVLLEPFRPGVAERLGIGPEVCLRRNARLVYGRMTGWGQDGPWSQMAGHDIDYIAVTGALHAIGRAGGPPQPPLNLLGDFAGGSMFLLVGVLAALWEREKSGLGQIIDASIMDGTASLTAFVHGVRAAGMWRDERGVNALDTGAPYYDVYQTADGEWMAVGAIEPAFFAELTRLLELDDPPPQHDQSRWPELRAALADRFRQRTRDEWVGVFTATDACVAPVLSFAEAADHPQIAGRGTLVVRDGLLQPAVAPRFSRTPGRISRGAPSAGADSREVFASWGVPNREDFLRCGAVLQTPTGRPDGA
ncbi:CaiB/BaiF CoA-transferase family protein [Dactylosporangium sp. AC04546]|uniref:CaiB/BaiF CoA transferase family protein n=1 Tax=Dactylosporangium sp. AC04546 TaxID=2862460 RepID=UPI0027E01C8F|nr:CaiB/BaiF CoA-transferase family protein [Dactylosporangium sp. AC04546]WVK86966.1 CaiB/BaiF CoA-transferase family protein [Dactylosporangium sp. AC04546]